MVHVYGCVDSDKVKLLGNCHITVITCGGRCSYILLYDVEKQGAVACSAFMHMQHSMQ
jgi:hypothetical protein